MIKTVEVLITQALKVLKENPGPAQRYKRERIYQMFTGQPGWERAEEFLRRQMGDTGPDLDTDHNRDTRDGHA